MLHRIMEIAQKPHFESTGCCPDCLYEPLKRGVNLKEGWWLCVSCEIWWQITT